MNNSLPGPEGRNIHKFDFISNWSIVCNFKWTFYNLWTTHVRKKKIMKFHFVSWYVLVLVQVTGNMLCRLFIKSIQTAYLLDPTLIYSFPTFLPDYQYIKCPAQHKCRRLDTISLYVHTYKNKITMSGLYRTHSNNPQGCMLTITVYKFSNCTWQAKSYKYSSKW